MRRLIVILVALVLVGVPLVGFGETGQRVALLIGNGNYTDAPLRNPVNDATDMASALRKLGFKVTLKTDANQRTMEKVVRSFGKELRKGGVGLFYYAGHGLQVNGRNYLIPIGANIETESEVKYEAVDAGRVLGQMEDAGNEMNIVMLDACRNNPFSRSWRSAEKGLARMDAPKGSYIAYATAPGSVAADGTGRNGTFTNSLLRYIKVPGLTLESVMKRVRKDVVTETGSKQVPWSSSSIIGDFYFETNNKQATRAVSVHAKRISQSLDAEEEMWRIVKTSSEIDDYKVFLDEYPNSRFRGAAKLKIQQLRRAKNSKPILAKVDPSVANSKIGHHDENFVKLSQLGTNERGIPIPQWPQIGPGKKFKWKMVTTWPPHFPLLGENCDRFAELVNEKSNGRLNITVYGGGELVPPLGVFDAVSDGVVEMGNAASYYWAGRTPAAQWFATVPFGLNTSGMIQWLHHMGGLSLWEEVYQPFNIIPRPAGSMGFQMGGWFNRKINSMSDLTGLKMRIPGLGGKVLAHAGGNAILVAGGEIYTSLNQGIIDATEWMGPFLDLKMGFYKVARYYYYPGWHEPGTSLEFTFNRKAYNALPQELREVLDNAALDSENWIIEQSEIRNRQAMRTLKGKHGVKPIPFPDSVLKGLEKISRQVLADEAAKDEVARKVYKAYQKVQQELGAGGSDHAQAYYNQ